MKTAKQILIDSLLQLKDDGVCLAEINGETFLMIPYTDSNVVKQPINDNGQENEL